MSKLKVNNLSCQKGYNLLFENLSFEINSGEVLKISGPNGSGKTSLLTLFNIIKFSNLHICQDSGSMHIASFYQKKNVCIFNNHDPHGKWFPLNKNAKLYRLKGDINTISPNLVYSGIKNFLNSK